MAERTGLFCLTVDHMSEVDTTGPRLPFFRSDTRADHDLAAANVIVDLEPRQSDGCKLKTGPVSPVVAAHPAEYVCSEDLFY